MTKAAIVAAAALAATMAVGIARGDKVVKCAARPHLAGPCSQVHGRLNAWNGGPATEKIWVIGTQRLLAVYDRADGSSVMPKAIRDQLGDFSTRVYADYRVCPLEKETAGHQGYVCIEAAKHIRVERHQRVHGKDYVGTEHIPDTKPGTLVD